MQAKKPGVIAVNAARLGTETKLRYPMGRGGRGARWARLHVAPALRDARAARPVHAAEDVHGV